MEEKAKNLTKKFGAKFSKKCYSAFWRLDSNTESKSLNNTYLNIDFELMLLQKLAFCTKNGVCSTQTLVEIYNKQMSVGCLEKRKKIEYEKVSANVLECQ